MSLQELKVCLVEGTVVDGRDGDRRWLTNEPREGRSIRCWSCRQHTGVLLERLASNFMIFMSIPSPMVELPSTRTLSRARAETFVALMWGRDIFGTSLGTWFTFFFQPVGEPKAPPRSGIAGAPGLSAVVAKGSPWPGGRDIIHENTQKEDSTNLKAQEHTRTYKKSKKYWRHTNKSSRPYKNEPSFWSGQTLLTGFPDHSTFSPHPLSVSLTMALSCAQLDRCFAEPNRGLQCSWWIHCGQVVQDGRRTSHSCAMRWPLLGDSLDEARHIRIKID